VPEPYARLRLPCIATCSHYVGPADRGLAVMGRFRGAWRLPVSPSDGPL